ncbi:MAG: glycoside hydrolase family 88 protein [Bacteroidales bacterium]|nr:glycoside hydrolase family 88 protein [Bacteroidales bacterium]
MMKIFLTFLAAATIAMGVRAASNDDAQLPSRAEVLSLLNTANQHWQTTHPVPGNSFWDEAAYHTGNMEAYFLTGDTAYYNYSERWAQLNDWKGAKSTDKTEWKYAQYGEGDDYVLFGDHQVCFQTYIDLYNVKPAAYKIARAREVMEYQMSTPQSDYWWWADGLYMVMPVMVKLHKLTQNPMYLSKLHEYWSTFNKIMYDSETGLYFRDGKYVYPKHKTQAGKKDFWARGDGWVLAAFAKVLKDMPEDYERRPEFVAAYQRMAEAVAEVQQPEGFWTRSMLDPIQAPGPETSGTAFFTYGLLWGMNNGYLEPQRFEPVVLKAWNYLANTAMQPDGSIGFVQPIGEKAIPGQIVNARSTANFGVGAFLLAASEMARYVSK